MAEAEGEAAKKGKVLLAEAEGTAALAEAWAKMADAQKLFYILDRLPQLTDKFGDAGAKIAQAIFGPIASGLGSIDSIQITDLGGTGRGVQQIGGLVPQVVFDVLSQFSAAAWTSRPCFRGPALTLTSCSARPACPIASRMPLPYRTAMRTARATKARRRNSPWQKNRFLSAGLKAYGRRRDPAGGRPSTAAPRRRPRAPHPPKPWSPLRR